MADSVMSLLRGRWRILPAAALLAALGSFWAHPAAADPGSAGREARQASHGVSRVATHQPVETAAGDPLGLHVFPEKFADFEEGAPSAPQPAQEPQLSPRQFHQEVLRWIGHWNASPAAPAP